MLTSFLRMIVTMDQSSKAAAIRVSHPHLGRTCSLGSIVSFRFSFQLVMKWTTMTILSKWSCIHIVSMKWFGGVWVTARCGYMACSSSSLIVSWAINEQNIFIPFFNLEKTREAYNQNLTLQDELGSDRGPRHRTCSARLAFYKNYELFQLVIIYLLIGTARSKTSKLSFLRLREGCRFRCRVSNVPCYLVKSKAIYGISGMGKWVWTHTVSLTTLFLKQHPMISGWLMKWLLQRSLAREISNRSMMWANGTVLLKYPEGNKVDKRDLMLTQLCWGLSTVIPNFPRLCSNPFLDSRFQSMQWIWMNIFRDWNPTRAPKTSNDEHRDSNLLWCPCCAEHFWSTVSRFKARQCHAKWRWYAQMLLDDVWIESLRVWIHYWARLWHRQDHWPFHYNYDSCSIGFWNLGLHRSTIWWWNINPEPHSLGVVPSWQHSERVSSWSSQHDAHAHCNVRSERYRLGLLQVPKRFVLILAQGINPVNSNGCYQQLVLFSMSGTIIIDLLSSDPTF